MDSQSKKQLIEKLYKENYSRISSYCYLKLCNKSDVEEVVSDTFFKAFIALSEKNSEFNSYTAWLYTIARNTIYDKSKSYAFKNVSIDTEFVDKVSDDDRNIEENIMKEDSYK